MKIKLILLSILSSVIILSPLAQVAHASSSIGAAYDSSFRYGRAEVGTTESTPRVYQNGQELDKSLPYVWSSSDESVLSFDSTNRKYNANRIGNTQVTVSYQGDALSFEVKVRKLTTFSSPPHVQTLIPVLNMGTDIKIQGFKEKASGQPLSGFTITFYKSTNANPEQFCSAITDSNGDATCNSGMLLPSAINTEPYIYAYYAGDSTYGLAEFENKN